MIDTISSFENGELMKYVIHDKDDMNSSVEKECYRNDTWYEPFFWECRTYFMCDKRHRWLPHFLLVITISLWVVFIKLIL
jgi:hypothetical protein